MHRFNRKILLLSLFVAYIKQSMMNRRNFVLSSLSSSAILGLTKFSWATPKLAPHSQDIAPLIRLSSFTGNSEVEGDLPDEAHEIFWAKEKYLEKKGGIPKVSSEYDVVVIGGGLSGLASAYYLGGRKVLLIESNPRLGGNAKAQVHGKNYLSLGSAYITQPEEGGAIDQFLTTLNLKKSFRKVDHDDETVCLNGKFVPGFWKGATDPDRADEFKATHEKLKNIYDNNYPDIPIWNSSADSRRYFNSLDILSFSQWITREFGSNIHPHILEYFHLYCWSSFSGSPDELSAAQVLNFITSDMNGIQVLPGGNGLISETLYQTIRKRSNVTILTNTFAVDVKSENGKAVICYKNAANQLETVSAGKCIVASPKMVMRKVISGLSTAQNKAMDDMPYRAYLVANIFLKKKIPSAGYDLFALEGKVPTNEYDGSTARVFADVIFSDWASSDRTDKSGLTLYLPLPYEMAQQYLFTPTLYTKYQSRVKAKLIPVLANMGMTWDDVEGMRLVRYGHALPLAIKNGVNSGMFERASAPIDNTIFFANQDNWGNPCLETSVGSAMEAVRKVLNLN